MVINGVLWSSCWLLKSQANDRKHKQRRPQGLSNKRERIPHKLLFPGAAPSAVLQLEIALSPGRQQERPHLQRIPHIQAHTVFTTLGANHKHTQNMHWWIIAVEKKTSNMYSSISYGSKVPNCLKLVFWKNMKDLNTQKECHHWYS